METCNCTPTFWRSKPEQNRPIEYGDEYPANLPSQTIVQAFQNTVLRHPHKVSHRFQEGGELRTVTWLQFYQDARRFAKACIAHGAHPHQGVAIQGSNGYEWMVANIGSILARCIPTGVYPTNQPEDSRYVADLSKSEIVVVENEQQLEKYFEGGQSKTAHANCYVVWNRFSDQWRWGDRPVLSWDEFLRGGEEVSEEDLDRGMNAIQPGECCTLIPTSGTTGRPKGVMLTHDNLTYMGRVLSRVLHITSKDRMLSYLPLSHVAGQMLDCYGPMLSGCTVTLAGKDALRGKLVDYLKDAKPTLFFGVPRVYEKIQEAMQSKMKTAGWLQKRLLSWAQQKALQAVRNGENGEAPPRFYGLAKKLVLDKIRAAMGLDECRVLATGAAPISPETMTFWNSLNFDLLNMYGMSESGGVQTFNEPGFNRFGTAGTALPGTDLTLLPSDERGKQEIACRGRHVFLGYIGNPDETEAAFTEDGYLKTGDYGDIDPEGYLTITGRKKELIVTAGGENVAPVPIEDRFKEELPYLSHAVCIGDRRKFLSAVFTFKCEMDDNGQPTPHLAKDVQKVFRKLGSRATTHEEASSDPLILAHIEEARGRVNQKAPSSAARVQKFVVLPQELSVTSGTLTPTLKVRRKQVLDQYGAQIEQVYASA